MGTAAKMHDEIMLKGIWQDFHNKEISENELFDALTGVNGCDAEIERELKHLNLHDDYMQWIYINIK